jgi:hypothetical protein
MLVNSWLRGYAPDAAVLQDAAQCRAHEGVHLGFGVGMSVLHWQQILRAGELRIVVIPVPGLEHGARWRVQAVLAAQVAHIQYVFVGTAFRVVRSRMFSRCTDTTCLVL